MATQSGGHHLVLHFARSLSDSRYGLHIYLQPHSRHSASITWRQAHPPFFYEALLPFIIWLQWSCLVFFSSWSFFFYFTTRKLLGRAFLTSFETSSAKPQVLLCITVRKPVDTCSKISVNRSCWHHKVTTWIWEAFLDLCLIQRCASPPLLSGALPEWSIYEFAKKNAKTKQRAACGFRHT